MIFYEYQNLPPERGLIWIALTKRKLRGRGPTQTNQVFSSRSYFFVKDEERQRLLQGGWKCTYTGRYASRKFYQQFWFFNWCRIQKRRFSDRSGTFLHKSGLWVSRGNWWSWRQNWTTVKPFSISIHLISWFKRACKKCWIQGTAEPVRTWRARVWRAANQRYWERTWIDIWTAECKQLAHLYSQRNWISGIGCIWD